MIDAHLSSQIADRAVAVLNEALEMDRAGVSNLFEYRILVNGPPFIDHPSIQVAGGRDDKQVPWGSWDC